MTHFDKKIIFITPWFGTFAGGLETLSRFLASGLKEMGIDIQVYTTCSKSPYGAWWENGFREGNDEFEGIHVERFKVNDYDRERKQMALRLLKAGSFTDSEKEQWLLSGINSDNLTSKLKGELGEDTEAVAFSFGHGLTYSVLQQYPGQISLIPCFHNESMFYWYTTDKLLRNARTLFFLSEEEKQLCLDVFGYSADLENKTNHVTGIGVNINDSVRHYAPMDVLPDNYFLYIGRLDYEKNVVMMCNWFMNYREQAGSNTYLVILGDGEQSFIPKNRFIIRVGFVSDEDKHRIIAHSKAVINLSIRESFSYVLLESWQHSRPVVVSGFCSVTQGHTIRANAGLYVSDQEEFALSLKLIEKDNELADYLGSCGRRYVEQYFSKKDVLDRFLSGFPCSQQ